METSSKQARASKLSEAMLDQALKQMFDAPEDLPERIISACHQESQYKPLDDEAFLRPEKTETGRHWRWAGWLSSTAAAAAVVLVLNAYFTTGIRPSVKQDFALATDASSDNISGPSEGQKFSRAIAEALPPQEDVVCMDMEEASESPVPERVTRFHASKSNALALPPKAVYAASSPSTSKVLPSSGFSLQDSRRLHAAFTGNATQSARASSAAQASQQHIQTRRGPHSAQSMASDISQVWLTEQPLPTVDTLKTLLAPYGISCLETNSTDSVLIIRFQTTDVILQQIVDMLHDKRGLILLSPVLPQPGEADMVAFEKAPVNYSMKLIKK